MEGDNKKWMNEGTRSEEEKGNERSEVCLVVESYNYDDEANV